MTNNIRMFVAALLLALLGFLTSGTNTSKAIRRALSAGPVRRHNP